MTLSISNTDIMMSSSPKPAQAGAVQDQRSWTLPAEETMFTCMHPHGPMFTVYTFVLHTHYISTVYYMYISTVYYISTAYYMYISTTYPLHTTYPLYVQCILYVQCTSILHTLAVEGSSLLSLALLASTPC